MSKSKEILEKALILEKEFKRKDLLNLGEYNKKALRLAEEELEDFKNLSEEEAKDKLDYEYNFRKNSCVNFLEKERKKVLELERIEEEIEKSDSEVDKEVQRFVINQINLNKEYGITEWVKKELEKEKPDFETWYKEKIEMMEQNVNYFRSLVN